MVRETLSDALECIREMDAASMTVDRDFYLKILQHCARFEVPEIAREVYSYIKGLEKQQQQQQQQAPLSLGVERNRLLVGGNPLSSSSSAPSAPSLLDDDKALENLSPEELKQELNRLRREGSTKLRALDPQLLDIDSEEGRKKKRKKKRRKAPSLSAEPSLQSQQKEPENDAAEEEEDDEDEADDDGTGEGFGGKGSEERSDAKAHAPAQSSVTSAKKKATAVRSYIRMDSVLYNAVMNVFAECRDKRSVVEMMLEMQRDSIPIDVDTYNCLVKLAAKSGDHEGAMKILTQMKQDGVSPNGETEIILMDYM